MSGNDILGTTMSGLEAGFKVSHIAAFDLKTCLPDSEASRVLDDLLLKDFDHIPVKDGARIIGVLERKIGSVPGTARNVMRALDDSMLVSAEESLPKFLPFLRDCPFRLVVKGTEIQGIVTLSDVAKLPVRLMAFTLVTHLEMSMAGVIRGKYQTDADFLAQLHPRQRPTVEGRLKNRKKENLLISALDLSDFGHKITVVGKILEVTDFQEQLKPIVELRNSLDHAADFLEACGSVNEFLTRLKLAEHWIEELGSKLPLGML